MRLKDSNSVNTYVVSAEVSNSTIRRSSRIELLNYSIRQYNTPKFAVISDYRSRSTESCRTPNYAVGKVDLQSLTVGTVDL